MTHTVVSIIKITIAMLAILALVLWEKRDGNNNLLLSLCLVIAMLLIPQIFEDGDHHVMCMPTDGDEPIGDDERKGEPLYLDEGLTRPVQMYSEPLVVTPPTDSVDDTEPDYMKPGYNEELGSYQGLGRQNWFYDTTRTWPNAPRLSRSELMPVPLENSSLCTNISYLAGELNINVGWDPEILRLIEDHIPQGKPVYYGLALPVPTSLDEFILMNDSLFRTKFYLSKDVAHLHLHIDANQKLIEQCDEILESIVQNKDSVKVVDDCNHSDAWQAYIKQEFTRTIHYMDNASYYYHKSQHGYNQDLIRTFWPNGSSNNDPNKFTSHPGYDPVARRLKTFAIVAVISGLTYSICDYMFFI